MKTNMKMRLLWIGSVILIVQTAAVHATDVTLSENFEDGEYTSKPTWTVANPAGGSTVISDPIRSGNLILSLHGTDTAHHRLETNVSVPWAGFELGFEFAAQTQEYSAKWVVVGDDFHINVRLTTGPSSPTTRFQMFNSSTGATYSETSVPNNQAPLDDWWTVRVFHDIGLNVIRGEIHAVSDDSLLTEMEFVPPTELANVAPITELRVACQETPGQYTDNITLGTVPEPATLTLVALGGLALVRRRRR